MDEIELQKDVQFQNGLNTHNKLVESWSDGRDDIVKAISWLKLLVCKFEGNWYRWVGVANKKKALKAAKNLRRSLEKTDKYLHDFMAYTV